MDIEVRRNVRDAETVASREDRVAVVDIGSNSVRLVVYEGPARTPFTVFNEKAICALGKGIAARGSLNPEGVEFALRTLSRFAKLAELMEVRRVDLLATAAVRDATDGPAFVAEVERRLGKPVTVLSGEEEARLAGLGVIAGRPDADGLMGDLGGGSLDLVMFDGGVFGKSATLPLGVLRLAEVSGGDRNKARDIAQAAFEGLPWLAQTRRRSLYPIGGAWRVLAHIAINQTGYPLHVLEGYELTASDALELTRLISGLSRKTLETIPWISPRRIEGLPISALLMERLLLAAQPKSVVFSVYGMREGKYFENLPKSVREADPLISACEALGGHQPRFRIDAREVCRWMSGLFPKESAAYARLRLAACLLGDVAWMEHPDYRAESAFRRVLRSPFTGVVHAERVALAYAVCARYGGEESLPSVWQHRALLREGDEHWAQVVGRAMRLAFSLSGGVPELLRQTQLVMSASALKLKLPHDDTVLFSEAVDRRLKALGKVLDLTTVIERAAGP